jgi:hypothetical protein
VCVERAVPGGVKGQQRQETWRRCCRGWERVPWTAEAPNDPPTKTQRLTGTSASVPFSPRRLGGPVGGKTSFTHSPAHLSFTFAPVRNTHVACPAVHPPSFTPFSPPPSPLPPLPPSSQCHGPWPRLPCPAVGALRHTCDALPGGSAAGPLPPRRRHGEAWAWGHKDDDRIMMI